MPNTPEVGQTVICDGEACVISDTRALGLDVHAKLQANGVLIYESATKRHIGKADDLAWDDELDAWYLRGRVLSREQRRQFAELYQRGVLQHGSPTWVPGNPPHEDDHPELYKEFVRDRPSLLSAVLEKVRVDDDVDDEFRSLAQRHDARVRQKRKERRAQHQAQLEAEAPIRLASDGARAARAAEKLPGLAEATARKEARRVAKAAAREAARASRRG